MGQARYATEQYRWVFFFVTFFVRGYVTFALEEVFS